MKKIILLVSLIFLLSGCSVNYDLEIFNNEYREKISINSLNTTESSYEIPVYFDETRVEKTLTSKKVADVEYYQKSNEQTNYVYYNNFAMEKYYKSYFVNSSFDFFAVYYNDVDEETGEDIITISTNNNMKIFDTYKDLDEIKINVKTNHKVKYSNADSHSKFTYTWNYDKNNYKDKYIQLILYKDKFVFNYDGKFFRNLTIVGLIVVSLAIIAIFIIKKSKKANKV